MRVANHSRETGQRRVRLVTAVVAALGVVGSVAVAAYSELAAAQATGSRTTSRPAGVASPAGVAWGVAAGGAGPLLAELVSVALRAAADTDGAVDPTLGSQLALLGYDRYIARTGVVRSVAQRPHRPR